MVEIWGQRLDRHEQKSYLLDLKRREEKLEWRQLVDGERPVEVVEAWGSIMPLTNFKE